MLAQDLIGIEISEYNRITEVVSPLAKHGKEVYPTRGLSYNIDKLLAQIFSISQLSLPAVSDIIRKSEDFVETAILENGEKIKCLSWSNMIAKDDARYIIYSVEIPEKYWSDDLLGLVIGMTRAMIQCDNQIKEKVIFDPNRIFDKVVGSDSLVDFGKFASNVNLGLYLGTIVNLPIDDIEFHNFQSSGHGTEAVTGLALPSRFTHPAHRKPYTHVIGGVFEDLYNRYPDLKPKFQKNIESVLPVLSEIKDMLGPSHHLDGSDILHPVDIIPQFYSGTWEAIKPNQQYTKGTLEKIEYKPPKRPFLFSTKVGKALLRANGSQGFRKAPKVPAIETNIQAYSAIMNLSKLCEIAALLNKKDVSGEDIEKAIVISNINLNDQIDLLRKNIPEETQMVLGRRSVNLAFHLSKLDDNIATYLQLNTINKELQYPKFDINNAKRKMLKLDLIGSRTLEVSQYMNEIERDLITGRSVGDLPEKIKKTIIGEYGYDLRNFSEIIKLKRKGYVTDFHRVYELMADPTKIDIQTMNNLRSKTKIINFLADNYPYSPVFTPLIPNSTKPIKVYDPINEAVTAATMIISAIKFGVENFPVDVEDLCGAAEFSGRKNGIPAKSYVEEITFEDGSRGKMFCLDSLPITSVGRNPRNLPYFEDVGMGITSFGAVLGAAKMLAEGSATKNTINPKVPVWAIKTNRDGSFVTKIEEYYNKNKPRLKVSLGMYQPEPGTVADLARALYI